jgi:hypothetical protein
MGVRGVLLAVALVFGLVFELLSCTGPRPDYRYNANVLGRQFGFAIYAERSTVWVLPYHGSVPVGTAHGGYVAIGGGTVMAVAGLCVFRRKDSDTG